CLLRLCRKLAIEKHSQLIQLAQCDERAGCCKKCARFGLPCSGAIRGAVFLDMTEKVSCSSLRSRKKKKKRAVNTKETKEEQTKKPLHVDSAAKQQSSTEDNGENRSAVPAASNSLPTDKEAEISYLDILEHDDESEFSLYQPHTEPASHFDDDKCFGMEACDHIITIPPELDASAYNEYCFVGNFAQLIISSRRSYSSLRPQSWILELPHLAATNALPSSLRYAMHAAALLYHAVTNHDTRAKIAAVKWYLAGIQTYRATILKPPTIKALTAPMQGETQTSDEPCISDIAEICVPIVFSFYEALRGASSDAELLHHAAATEMLEKRGPEKCVSGLAHSVMRSLRAREAFYSIMHNRSANFSSPEWLFIPFQQKHKICYDRLIDVLLSFTNVLRLPYMNQKGATLRCSVNRVHDLSTARKADIEEKANSILAQLQDWWLDFRQEHCEIITLDPGGSFTPENAYMAVASPSSVLPLSGPWMVANGETLTATPHVTGPDGQSDVDAHQAAISAYATGVFNASMYLNMINPFCGDAVRTNFSVTIVSLFALEDTQRDEARRMLSQWKVHDQESTNCLDSTKSQGLVL
ncbi:hypothetical protein V8C42DRAFT_360520, partial [Trichoderma barbatum]